MSKIIMVIILAVLFNMLYVIAIVLAAYVLLFIYNEIRYRRQLFCLYAKNQK